MSITRRRWFRWTKRIAITLATILCAAWVGIRFIPMPATLLATPPESLEFTDRHGRTLRETRVAERFRREAKEIPQNVVHAMLAAEDKRFFAHDGVDWLASARAAWTSLRAGKKKSGASTITQQLVKISVPRERTWTTKLVEMATALRVEQVWTKEQILGAYLNRLDFGNLNYGIAAAANYYFGKPLADLSDAEVALLAGLPWNPTRINPHTNPAGAKARQRTVLRRMFENGWLTQEQHDRAVAEPLRFQKNGREFNAPHFVDVVLTELGNRTQTTSAQLRLQGAIRTTLDLELNQFIERTIADKLERLKSENVRDAAAVVLDNRTGEVLGLVGSGNYFAPGSGMVNGATQPRSAGSTIKPVTYLLALERGANPATIVPDVPTEFSTPTGPYRPENYHRHCSGPVRYREALACSLNIPAVRVLQSIGGAAPLQKRLCEWGVSTLPKDAGEYGLGLTIGNAEVRLLELVNVYATLARAGEWLPVTLVFNSRRPSSIGPVGGSAAQRSPARGSRENFWLIADMLADNEARLPAFGTNSSLRFDFPVACKTGTSTDFRDNWAVAYTPEFTVGVWVGNFNGSPMREVSGVTGAAPIMHDVMRYLRGRFGTTWFARPAEIVEREVHPLTGRLTTRAGAIREKFSAEQLPPVETPDDLDAQGRVKLGAEFGEWAAGGDNHLRDQVVVQGGGLHLVSPSPGTVFLLDPDVPSSIFVPLVASGGDSVVWESATLRVREQAGKVVAEATEGEHHFTVRDRTTGTTLTTWIRVRAL